MLGARSFTGSPYDGHTLAAQLEQTNTLLLEIGTKPTTAIFDLGYRCVDGDSVPVQMIHLGKKLLAPRTLLLQGELSAGETASALAGCDPGLVAFTHIACLRSGIDPRLPRRQYPSSYPA
jgi:hypothetical protein